MSFLCANLAHVTLKNIGKISSKLKLQALLMPPFNPKISKFLFSGHHGSLPPLPYTTFSSIQLPRWPLTLCLQKPYLCEVPSDTALGLICASQQKTSLPLLWLLHETPWFWSWDLSLYLLCLTPSLPCSLSFRAIVRAMSYVLRNFMENIT